MKIYIITKISSIFFFLVTGFRIRTKPDTEDTTLRPDMTSDHGAEFQTTPQCGPVHLKAFPWAYDCHDGPTCMLPCSPSRLFALCIVKSRNVG